MWKTENTERGAVTTSVIPITSTRLRKTEPYEVSRSRSKNRGARVPPWERVGYLSPEPPCGGMLGDIEAHDLPAVVRQNS
jgi:hypothetical protein